jgi:hypothetical protein
LMRNRGLVITMLVVVVVLVVGTGAMAWATNDTDESVEEELASAQLGLTSDGPESSASYQTIHLVLHTTSSRPVRVFISPVYDTPPGAKCVKRDATNPPPVEVSRETVVTVGVTVLGTYATGCHINRSQMFWSTSSTSGLVALIKPAGKRVQANCWSSTGCQNPSYNTLRIFVR